MSDVVLNAPVAEAPENHSASEAQEAEQPVNVHELEESQTGETEALEQPEQGQDGSTQWNHGDLPTAATLCFDQYSVQITAAEPWR